MDLNGFIQEYTGVPVDVDGAYDAQCWDLWSLYAQLCYNVPQADTNTTDGYASSVYTERYDISPALQSTFVQVDSSQPGQYGDVAFWAVCPAYKGSHVAIVVRDNGDTLTCFSQNPNTPQVMNLTKSGLLGYLRPRTTVSNTEGDTDMPASTDMIRLHPGDSDLHSVEYAIQFLVMREERIFDQVQQLIDALGGFRKYSDAVWSGQGDGTVEQTPLYQLRDAQNHAVGGYEMTKQLADNNGINSTAIQQSVETGLKNAIEGITTTVEVKKS